MQATTLFPNPFSTSGEEGAPLRKEEQVPCRRPLQKTCRFLTRQECKTQSVAATTRTINQTFGKGDNSVEPALVKMVWQHQVEKQLQLVLI